MRIKKTGLIFSYNIHHLKFVICQVYYSFALIEKTHFNNHDENQVSSISMENQYETADDNLHILDWIHESNFKQNRGLCIFYGAWYQRHCKFMDQRFTWIAQTEIPTDIIYWFISMLWSSFLERVLKVFHQKMSTKSER